jgi:hypothetical protein
MRVNPETIQPTRREEQSSSPCRWAVAGLLRSVVAENWQRGFIRPVTTLSVSESRMF